MAYHKWYSPNLRHDFEVKVYGDRGRPCLVFPCSEGKCFDFEDMGMIATVQHLIDEKRLQVICVSSVDEESYFNKFSPAHERSHRHMEYERCIMQEVVPFIRNNNPNYYKGIICAGASWGGYHSLNFLLKHPDVFDTCISMSGVFGLEIVLGDYCDDNVYFSDPMRYLPGLNDEWTLQKLREAKIILGSGQGPWEMETLRDSDRIYHLLESKGVHVWRDLWGHDVAHDWYWWRKMFPHYLSTCDLR
eukprot:TRINITY_DN20692_c0_g1_i1.p1 TRINITY_DN20692_c0_g1~~TRINITY_DN20692_c0_g1_i1.p1  ORF type:complete len:246 (-),score=39.60 TRINITY_DN20692_c0_g1_i1:10-747(-)